MEHASEGLQRSQRRAYGSYGAHVSESKVHAQLEPCLEEKQTLAHANDAPERLMEHLSEGLQRSQRRAYRSYGAHGRASKVHAQLEPSLEEKQTLAHANDAPTEVCETLGAAQRNPRRGTPGAPVRRHVSETQRESGLRQRDSQSLVRSVQREGLSK